MSVSVTLNGSSYSIPQTGEPNWGSAVTSWIQAVSQHTLQKSGGTFTLTADVDFGSTYGVKSAYFKSRTASGATAGAIRFAYTDVISWRNSANSANVDLKPNATTNTVLSYNGVDLVGTSLTQTLTNKTIAAGSNTISGLANANIDAAAAIAYSKLALTGSIVNADIGAAAAIAYSKLNLSGSIVNADVGAAAAIAYSKLALTGSIVNADIGAAAAIARTKFASGTASHVLINDGSGVMSSEAQLAASRGGTGQNMSASSGVVKVSGGTFSAASLVNADVDAAAAIAYSKLALTDSIVNADIDSAAAIAYSKLDLAGSVKSSDVNSEAATSGYVLVANGSGGASWLSTAGTITGTASRAAEFNGSGNLVASSVTTTELGYVSGVTSAIQTQLNSKATTSALTTHEADTSTHGVGEVVGTSESQTLTNKTLALGSNSVTTTASRVVVSNGSGAVGVNASLVWDTTNTRLGIDQATPQAKLSVGSHTPGTGEATYKGLIQIATSGGTTTSEGGLEFKGSPSSNGYGWRITAPDSSGVHLHFQSRTDSASWTERARLTSDGKFGVGTSSAQQIISAGSSAGSGAVGMSLDWTGGGGPYAVSQWTADHSTGEVRFGGVRTNYYPTFYANNTEYMRVSTAGVVRMNSYSDGAMSFINGNGTISSSSDERLKEDIEGLGSVLDKVTQLRGVKFKWKDRPEGNDTVYIGVIAQELEAQFPELVGGAGQTEKMKGVHYHFMAGVFIEAIKELKAELDSVKAELQALKGE
jgi:hypothetical protein